MNKHHILALIALCITGNVLVGHTRLSSELDELVREVNKKCCSMELDNHFEDPGPSSRFFFMSDHYSFIQRGIPSVWLFNGPEPNVHRPTDTPGNINYEKLENVTRLAFAIGLAVANREEMLELDVVPGIMTRGAHNTGIDWSKVIGISY
jgi:Zn-dependent M28 family amino/carboxypeptidase